MLSCLSYLGVLATPNRAVLPGWVLLSLMLLSATKMAASIESLPDWSVNPAAYQYSMQVVARLQFNGVPVNDPGTMIGAFSGATVRGTATPVVINGNAFFYMTVYSNSAFGDTLKFRAYYPATDRVYGTTAVTTFLATKTLGSVFTPFIVNIDPGIDFVPVLTAFHPDTTLQYIPFSSVNLSDNLISQDDDPVVWNAIPGSSLNVALSNDVLSVTPAVTGWTGTDSVLVTVTESTSNGYSTSRYIRFTVQQDYGAPVLSAIPAQVILPGNTFSPVPLNPHLTFNGPDHQYDFDVFPFQGSETLPDWSGIPMVGPVMKMVVRPLFNSLQLAGTGSRLAVFVNNTLAGVASPSGIPPYVTYTLNIQNVASGSISFRFYDAVNQYIYLKNTSLNFAAGTTVGTVSTPWNLQLSPLTISLGSDDILRATVADTSWRGITSVDVMVEDSQYPLERRDTSRVFFSVTSTSVDPVFTSLSTVSFQENTCMQLYDAQSTAGFFSEGNGLAYSLAGGADMSKFQINSSTGVLSWNTFTPDFENAGDSDNNNMYQVVLRSTDLLGKFSDLSLTVTVTDNPVDVTVVQISGATTVCNGTSTTLTASGSGTYLWSNGLGTNSSVLVTPTSATSYTVTLTDTGGCTDTESVTVTVNSLPTAAIGGVTTICNGTSTTLTASGASQFAWSDNLGSSSAVQVSPTTTTTYTVTVTDDNSCTDTETATVTVNSLPTASISGNTTICAGASTILTASGAPTYAWSDNLGSSSAVQVSPATTTTYTVTVTDGNNCTDTETATVTVNSLPVAAISGVSTICNGTSATLTASGGSTYAWSDMLGSNVSVLVSPTATSTYTVTVTDGNSCTDTETATVTVNSLPTASISGNTTICAGVSTTLTASGGLTYSWSNGVTSHINVVSPQITTIYTVTVTSTQGCTASDAALVNVINTPDISGVSPLTASTGAQVIVSGSGFTGTSQVKLNNINSSWTLVSDTQISVVMPFSGTILNVGVTTMCGTDNISTGALTISSFSPTTGSPGSLITITGTNMNGASSVTIAGVPQIIVSNTSNSVTVFLMPGSTTGKFTVVTGTGAATSSGTFTVTATPVPSVQQGSKLSGNSATAISLQGQSVAVSSDGKTAVVGSPSDNSNAGGAWIFVRSGTTWTQQGGKLLGTGAVGAAKQGYSVAISADGNTVAIGGNLDNLSNGAVWVFVRTGSSWSQQGSKLVGAGNSGYAQQGSSLSISADGNTIASGGIADDAFAGAVWLFTRVGGVWSQQGGKLTGTGAIGKARQGCSVSLGADGKYLISGGYNHNTRQGTAWIFTRNGSVWSQQAQITGTGGTSASYQGYSVAISADGNTAIIGGPNNLSTLEGAVWVFTRSGSSWNQQGGKLTGTGGSGSSRQGFSVAISADGNTAVWGGFGDDSNKGAMWVYRRNGGVWSQQGSGKLTGTGAVGFAKQGTSIALSSTGSTALLGGPADNSNKGAAWVFTAGSSSSFTAFKMDDRQQDITVSPDFVLKQSIPNPSSDLVRIDFILPAACAVEWEISDAGGHIVLTANREYPAGENVEIFDVSNRSGIYWYTLKSPFGVKTGKMMVIE